MVNILRNNKVLKDFGTTGFVNTEEVIKDNFNRG